MTLSLGDPAPDFALPDTGGTPTPLHDGPTAATVVVFTCNHCPYARAWHDRIDAVARDYADRDVRVLQINPNDSDRYPADSLDAMRQRVREGEFASPYLRDSSQEVARAWGATVTPDVFVLDAAGRVAYHGAPDEDHSNPSLHARWLRSALDAILASDPVPEPETQPVGCSIKWRREG